MTATWEDWRIEDERQCSPGLKAPPMTTESEVLQDRRDEAKRLLEIERNACGMSDEWHRLAQLCDDLGDQIGFLEDQEERSRGPSMGPNDVAPYDDRAYRE